MKDEIKEILDKFDKILENYELDKKIGEMSVDSICHLFPYEMITIKDYITNLQEEKEIYKKEKDTLMNSLFITRNKYNNDKARYIRKAKNYKTRIYKAIKYINSHLKQEMLSDFTGASYIQEYIIEPDYLLNILQGEQNE